MSRLLRRSLLAIGLLAAVTPALAQSVPPSPFSKTVFFGDSLTDGGFFRPLLPAASQSVTGQFTTNPGLVWSQHLAQHFESNAEVAWKATGATPASAQGNNWSVGGARVAVDSVGGLGYTPSLRSQYAAYLAAGNKVDSQALYTVWGGANDLFYATGVYQATLAGGGTAAQAQAAAQAEVGAAVTAHIGLIGALKTAGANYILVPTIPDLGMTPAYRVQGAAAQGLGTALTVAYNNALFSGLAASKTHVIPMDTFTFLREIVASPGTYGLSNVTGQACLTQPAPAGDSSLFCNPLSTVPGGANSYLFADGVHPTSGAHQVLSEFAVSLIEAPQLNAVLSQSALITGQERARMLQGVATSRVGDSDGMRWWADVRGLQPRFNGSAGFDGAGGSGALGLSWKSGALFYGLTAGHGQQNTDFGYRRGHYSQTDTSLGGFLGWSGERAWVSGQAEWTKLRYKIDREVHLGPATRVHHGAPDGENVSAGLAMGWRFESGALQHGPVLSVLSQQVRVDAYAEDSTQSTALAYHKQRVDSLLGSAGWQASYAISEHITPFAQLTWNREFEDAPAQVWAQALSMPNALPYAVPGLRADDSYGVLGVGVRSKLFGLDVTAGSNVSVEQRGGSHASLYLTLSGAF